MMPSNQIEVRRLKRRGNALALVLLGGWLGCAVVVVAWLVIRGVG